MAASSTAGTGGFRRDMLDRSVISRPLLEQLRTPAESAAPHPLHARVVRRTVPPGIGLYGVVIDLHYDYPGGADEAAQAVRSLVDAAIARCGQTPDQGVEESRTLPGGQYVVAHLEPAVIREVARLDRQAARRASGTRSAIHRIWPDFRVRALINASAATVKADAGRAAFSATGRGITWAVLDSGIDGDHPHFAEHRNLKLEPALEHRDLTGAASPLTDPFGHGTHVAGILAGHLKGTRSKPVRAARRERDENDEVGFERVEVEELYGMAPQATVVSYKILDENGDGDTSTIITALQEIARVNDHGRDLKIHGVNLSVGYPFDPDWFACGQSPLCVEVDQLVQSGVVVVAAAGNTGYAWNQDFVKGAVASGADLTINDPGNAGRAITVGSTHRDSPHLYGVSYFSSKGPTGDGRQKPDLVAPGERILSCAAGRALPEAGQSRWQYVEDSGTSMAAPHVSGVIAAFLSIRREFIGRPDDVKRIFLDTATDLNRVKEFQGRGLVDLMRAIQSV